MAIGCKKGLGYSCLQCNSKNGETHDPEKCKDFMCCEHQDVKVWIELHNLAGNKIIINAHIPYLEYEKIDKNMEFKTTDRKEFHGTFVMAECGGY